MNSVAFTIGTWPVYWYGILISAALLIGMFLAQRLAKSRGYDVDKLWSVLLLMVPAAVVGARLYYVLFRWDLYGGDPLTILKVWHGGLAVHGGILGGLLAILIGCKIWKLDSFGVLDCVAPALALGQAIGRWGNFFNGEAYGGVTSLPWGIHVAADPYLHHPTFLYESIWDFLLFLLLLAVFKKSKRTGNVACLYFMIYSVGRFFIESLRTDSLMIGPLKQAQVISVCLFVLAAVIFWLRNRKKES
ncbi:MAG: prolipoprotein diacylglyceryl transferase [Bacillota bacterium]|jgi:phosphatidylglycerol:prolipoprotein diacylglycerol transferase